MESCELLKSRDIGGKAKRGNFRVSAKRQIQGNFDWPCQQSEEKRKDMYLNLFFYFLFFLSLEFFNLPIC